MKSDALARLIRFRAAEVKVMLLGRPKTDASTDAGSVSERNARATVTSLTGIGSRAISIAVSFITIPILLRHLGIERYGIWLTISAGAAWLSVLQFGVGPALLNRLSATDRRDRVLTRRLASTSWWLALMLAVLAVVPLALVYQFASWANIFNVPPGQLATDGRTVTAVVWFGFAVGLPLSIPTVILRARQEGYLANLIDIASSIGRLALIMGLVAIGIDMVGLAVGLAALGVVIGLAGSLLVFWVRYPDLRPSPFGFKRDLAISLLKTGAAFTGLNVASLVISYTDLIVITQVLGPAHVPPYAITFALLTMFLSIELTVLDAAWPAYSEAAAKRDGHWLRTTHRRLTWLFTLVALGFGAVLVATGGPLIAIWAGDSARPQLSVLVVISVLAVVQAYLLTHGLALAALGRVRLYSFLGLVNATVNLPVSVLLASSIGTPGVAVGTLIGYLIVGPFFWRAATSAINEIGRLTPPDGQILRDAHGISGR